MIGTLQFTFIEIAMKLKRLTPNRHDLHEEIDEKIDPSFIKQLIGGGSFDSNMFYAIMEFIVSRVIALEPAASNEETKKWYSSFLKDCSQKSYKEILPVFFNKMNERLDEIQKQCDIIRKELQQESQI